MADSEATIGPDGLLASLGHAAACRPTSARRSAPRWTARPGYYYGLGPVIGWVASAAGSAWNLAGLSYGELNPPSTAQSIDLTKLMDIAGYKIK